MRSFDLYIFDLDGTLIDSRGDIVAACNYALKTASLPQLSPAQIACLVGDGARTLCARASGLSEDDARVEAMLESFLSFYEEHPVEHTTMMHYALPLLNSLSVESRALCTNKSRRVTDRILLGLSLREYFQATWAGGDTPKKKPDPEPILHLCQRLSVHPHRTLVIGDGPQDVLAARNAGATSLAVCGGFVSDERLLQTNPDHSVSSLEEAFFWLHGS